MVLPEVRRPLILASGSPRRAELLRQAGIRFDVSAPDVDETLRDGEAPEAYVRRLAAAKAGRIAALHPGRVVLGADTTVVVDGEVLGKPRDADDSCPDARPVVGSQPSGAHRRLSDRPGRRGTVEAAVTTVEFRPLSGRDCRLRGFRRADGQASACAIQGGAAEFVSRLDGAFDNVVGLPLALIQGMCRARGIQVS